MPRALLIPGAWHRAESYQPLKTALRAHTFTLDVLGLPIYAASAATKKRRDAAMADYHTALTDYLANHTPSVILLHSMAGAIFYSAPLANTCTAPIIAIAAIIPSSGESIADVEGAAFSGRLQYVCRGRYSLLTPSAMADMYEGHQTNNPYDHLSMQPYRPFTYKMPSLLAHKVADPLVHYAVCKTDKIIAPRHQRAYAHRIGARVVEMPWGHAPHASAPTALAALIADIAGGTL